MKDLIISQVNNKYLRMSLTAHSAGRLVVHNLLEKENSFQVEAQGETQVGELQDFALQVKLPGNRRKA